MTMEHVLRDFKARVNQANHLTEFLNKKKVRHKLFCKQGGLLPILRWK
ncbi:MAG: hypothetical protein LRY71_06605 [Bacillaceae bacterium]|nr:hypothetical protein [Bacillaceae bacterium]